MLKTTSLYLRLASDEHYPIPNFSPAKEKLDRYKCDIYSVLFALTSTYNYHWCHK